MGILISYDVPNSLHATNPRDITGGRKGAGLIQHIVILSASAHASDHLQFNDGGGAGGNISGSVVLTAFTGGTAAAPLAIPFTDGFTVQGVKNASTSVRVVVEWDFPMAAD